MRHNRTYAGKKNSIFLKLFLTTFSFFVISSTYSKDSLQTYKHAITIYVIAPASPIDWYSPSSLYHSVKKSFLKKILQPKRRFLGHMMFRLQTSLLSEPLWIGIVPDDNRQMVRQLFVKKVGLGVIGFPFKAKMEDRELLERSIDFSARKKSISFITYRINEVIAKDILDFLSNFQKKINDEYAPCNFYGGAFWPLYEYEGSGCSALCIAALAAGGITYEEIEEWKVKCKIPLNLIGGTMNGGKKIKITSLKRSTQWHSGIGKENIDFINFEIFDPGKVIDWIYTTRTVRESCYVPVVENGIPGLYFDCVHTYKTSSRNATLKREQPNIFLKGYYKMIESNQLEKK